VKVIQTALRELRYAFRLLRPMRRPQDYDFWLSANSAHANGSTAGAGIRPARYPAGFMVMPPVPADGIMQAES